MSATIKDVAREAGVASGTISKYLNGGSVRPENKKNIEEAIRRLEYRPTAWPEDFEIPEVTVSLFFFRDWKELTVPSWWQLLKNMCGRWAAF